MICRAAFFIPMTARRFFLSLAFTALALGFLIPILWGVWIYRERTRIKAAETRIQAEGLPVTLKDVFSSHVAPEDNAAPLLEEVKVKHQALKESGFTMRLPGSGSPKTDTAFLDPVQLEELKSQMASPEVQTVLDLLREASRKPAAQFDRDYSKGAATDIKAVPMILYGAQLLNLSAWLQAQDGDIHGAMEDILNIARLARLGLDDPMTISWLVGMSADLVGFSGVQLVYHPTPEGVTLYSLGANRKDDGGVRGKNRRSGDMAWSVQRPPAS